jgi:hypothetical protein
MRPIVFLGIAGFFLGCGGNNANVQPVPKGADSNATIVAEGKGSASRQIDPETLKKREESVEDRINARTDLTAAEKKTMIEERRTAGT